MNAPTRISRSRHLGLGAGVVLATLAGCSAGRHYDVTHDQIVTMMRETRNTTSKLVFLGATSSRAYYSLSSPSWFSDVASEDIYSVALNGVPGENGVPAESRRSLPQPERTGLPSLTNEFFSRDR